MEEQALVYIKQSLDKATQKGAFNLSEVANIVSALECLNQLVNKDKKQEDVK